MDLCTPNTQRGASDLSLGFVDFGAPSVFIQMTMDFAGGVF